MRHALSLYECDILTHVSVCIYGGFKIVSFAYTVVNHRLPCLLNRCSLCLGMLIVSVRASSVIKCMQVSK